MCPRFAGLSQTSEVSETSEVYSNQEGEAEKPPLSSFLLGAGSQPPPLEHGRGSAWACAACASLLSQLSHAETVGA